MAEPSTPLTVLCVDDEPLILRALRRLLRGGEWRVLLAGSGEEALAVLDREPVQVLVSDLHMPGMDGLSLVQRVGAERPEVVCLILSGEADGAALLDAINLGRVYGYLLKPWDDRALVGALRQAGEVARLRQENRALVARLEEHNRRLQEEVERRVAQILAIERRAEIGRHAAQIVHNLNGPLQVMLSATEMVRDLVAEHGDADGAAGALLDTLTRNAEQLIEIVQGILDHGREQEWQGTEAVDLNRAVARELEFFAMDPVFRYQVEVNTELAPDLPRVEANPLQLKQVLDNLIRNAVDAMEESPRRELTVVSRRDGPGTALEVADTGCGIPPEHLERLFSPSFTTKPPGKGTGLGLSSVKATADAYGWEVSFASRPGAGTRCVLRFPPPGS